MLDAADITVLQTWWNTPTAGFQTTIKNSVNGTANGTPVASQPGDLTAASTQAAILEAKALRWLLTGGGNTAHADFVSVRNTLTSYARVTGGSGITSPLAARGYYVAFDLINSGLTASERTAINTRLNTNVLANLGTPTGTGNQAFLNRSSRAFAAILAGNEANLDTAMGQLNSAFNSSTTNDGLHTDGDRYFNYPIANLATFMNSYVNYGGDTTGANQYKNAATQYAKYALGIRMPNGTSPSFHNSDNMPLAIHEMSRLIDDPALKAAAVWYAAQVNGHDWTSWSNATNNNWTYTDFMVLTDYSAGAAAPTWSPTYLAEGQSEISAFKNDWSTSSNYFATTAGIDGSEFAHMDTGAITVVANGAQVISEPGYNRYNGIGGLGRDTPMPNSPGGNNVDTSIATQHNVLLARNTGTSTWGIGTNGTTQTNTSANTTVTNQLDSQERGSFKGVMDFSTLKTTYTGGAAGGGVQERRSSGMVNEASGDKGYFVMTDSFRSTGGANKDFALNLLGKSTAANTAIETDTATYKKIRWSVNTYYGTTSGGVSIPNGFPYNQPQNGQVIAHIVSSDTMGSVAQAAQWMVDNYGSFIQTQRMTVPITNQTDGAFLTLFETGTFGAASKWTVTPVSGTDHASAKVVSTDGWTDWHVNRTSTSDILGSGSMSTIVVDSGAVVSDAQYTYIRKIGSTLDSVMFSRGTNLSVDYAQILAASHPMTASVLYNTGVANQVKGTVSGDELTNNSTLSFVGMNKRSSRDLRG